MTEERRPLKSERRWGMDGIEGFTTRSCVKGMGYTDRAFRGRPIVGICNTASDIVHCNKHLRQLVDDVKRGVHQAGGLGLEFPVMSLGEPFMAPTTMVFRNLMAMDVEESIRAYPFDAVVLLAGCDKTIPASLMGAISANAPAVMVPGGPQLNSRWRGRDVGSCTDCWLVEDAVRRGDATQADQLDLEDAIVRSPGHCSTMGTASTMACVAEALGFTRPGSAAIPAADTRRARDAEAAGTLAVELALEERRPLDWLSKGSFRNAMCVLQACSGSTNGIVHLSALAGRAGIELDQFELSELRASTPWLVNLKPSGAHLMEDFYNAGGVPALMHEIGHLLDHDAVTVTGRTVGEQLSPRGTQVPDVIAHLATPLSETGSLAMMRGNIAPDGAIVKVSASSSSLLSHTGPAVVFDGLDDLHARIDDPDLEITADSVLILRGAGPIGAPGMPEVGHLPIPTRLLQAGVEDMVRISDARMSGTAYGTCVLHVAPEGAAGGPLARVREGDRIRLDVEAGVLEALVDPAEWEARLAEPLPDRPAPARGYLRLYHEHVQQANLGCDFDFLRA